MNPNLTILAVGAAGPFAGLVVPELAKRGAKVRALIRDAKETDAVRKNGATEIAIGDLSDRASIDLALQGADAVFYIAPLSIPNEAEIGKSLVAAAQNAGVRRIVFSALMNPILSAIPHHIAKAPVEAAILESGMEFALLHPTVFFQNLAAAWPTIVQSGVFAEAWSTKTCFSWVDYRDVAEVAAIALTEERLNYGTYELCAEGHHNRHEVAALMSEILGREIRAERLDPAQVAVGPMAALRPMFDWYDRHGLIGNALTLRAILGREPRTLRAYIQELAASPQPTA